LQLAEHVCDRAQVHLDMPRRRSADLSRALRARVTEACAGDDEDSDPLHDTNRHTGPRHSVRSTAVGEKPPTPTTKVGSPWGECRQFVRTFSQR
jgi:hypothetical protein